MIALSAAQALSPAIERTKHFLFRPFRLGQFLKLALVAALTEGGMASCNFSSRLPSGLGGETGHPLHPFPPLHWPQFHSPAVPIAIAIILAIAVLVILFAIVIAYLLIRLRFSYFDCVLRMQHRIAPAWRLYHRQAMRYLGMSLCIGVAFLAVLAVAGAALYQRFKPLVMALNSDNKPTFADFLPLIGIVLLLGFFLAIAGSLIEIALSYFVLPHMALEDATIGEALSDVWGDIEAEPWQYIFFVLLRFLVTMAASIIAVIVLVIPFLILGGIGLALTLMLKAVSTGMAFLFGIPAAILLFALFVVALIAIGGTIGTFRRNYALLFYGGRYAPLGNILQPPLPPSPIPQWQPSPPAGPVPGMPDGV
jgi:hypothetical protein